MTVCFVCLKMYQEGEISWAEEHSYYMIRCQKKVLLTHKKRLKIRYQNAIEKGVYHDANAIHAWNRFRTSLGKKTGVE